MHQINVYGTNHQRLRTLCGEYCQEYHIYKHIPSP